MDLFFELLKLGAVGTIAGLFSSYLSNRDFRTQHWWERRIDAYLGLIQALSDMADYYGELFDAHIEDRELPDKRKSDLSERWSVGQLQVQRARHLGAFMFSSKVDTALKEFFKTKGQRQESYFEYLDHSYGVVQKCLNAVVEASKQDLQLRSPFWPFGLRAKHNKWLQATAKSGV